jgi:DNA-binding beta-propeller fold protein YncE
MINTDTNEKLNLPSYLLSGGTRPENLVVTPDGQKLYIVHSGSASVEILGY